jgi:membrane protease YdiL (CAAX protease family)
VRQIPQGLRWGLPTGLALGLLNLSVIQGVVPWSGSDITFLRETPHGRAPVAVMLPWAILIIAFGVELNFRGFLLGRLLALVQCAGMHAWGPPLAIVLSSLLFSYDPFMVATFKHLHWIALWDGVVWGMIWVRIRNLYATIVAHTVEVIVMYSFLKITLP